MTSGTIVRMHRTTDVIEIPSGRASTLPEGTSVRIMQSRGDSYTVWTDYGQMYRVDGKDADAIGLQPGSNEPAAAADTREFNDQLVWDVLKTVYDPEIPVNIYDLGLIYTINVHPETCHVDVKMTLTAPGCPVAGSLVAEVVAKVRGVEEVSGADVELVWDPPWTREMMSEAARLELGLL